MTLNSMLNTCGRRGSNYVNVHATEHIEKMLHSLSTKFENQSDDEETLNNSTNSSEEVSLDRCGYSADNDSDSGYNFSGDSIEVDSHGDQEAPAEMPVHPGLLRLTCRVAMSLSPDIFHELQKQVLTNILPIMKTTSAARFPLPELAMLPSILEKQKQILSTSQKEFKDLRLSALNLTRVIAMNRLSVPHLKCLLEVIHDDADCVVELLQVLIDVAARMELAPLWTLEFPLSVCSDNISMRYLSPPDNGGTKNECNIKHNNEESVNMACVRHQLPDVSPGFWYHHHPADRPASVGGFTVSLWIMLESRLVKKNCSIIPDKCRKSKTNQAGKTSSNNHLMSHFRTLSSGNGGTPQKYRTASSTRTCSNESISQQDTQALLTTEQVVQNLLHVFTIDSHKSKQQQPKPKESDSTNLNGNLTDCTRIRFQMWCEPTSGSVYFRLYSSQPDMSVSTTANTTNNKTVDSNTFKINQQSSKTGRQAKPSHNSSPSLAFGSTNVVTSSSSPKSKLMPVSEAGLKSVLGLKQWTHVCVSVMPESVESSSVVIVLNGLENYEMTLLHPPLKDDVRSTPVLSIGHQCVKDFTSVSRLYQIGNIAVFKDYIQNPESPLYIYCLGPDWVSQPLGPAGGLEKGTANNVSLSQTHLESVQYLLDRLMSNYSRNERFVNLIQTVAQQLTDKKGWMKMLHIRRALLAVYSTKDPFQLVIFPTNLPNQIAPQPVESTGFFSNLAKRVAISSSSAASSAAQKPSQVQDNNLSTALDANTSNFVNVFPANQWAESQPVQNLDKGLAKLTPYNRKTLDESLIPLGGLKVVLFLLAKITGEDKIGDLQEKALDLLLTTVRHSLTMRQELFDLGGYKLLSRIVCCTNFILSDRIVALLVNSTGSRPLLHSTSNGLMLCASNCTVLCMDVHLVRNLLLTWPFWRRINLNQGCSLLDALLLYVAEENAWQEVNAKKFQEWQILDALLFSCQQLLQEDNKLPSEKFCHRLVSLMDACVGSPPNIDQLSTLCEALLLMHPPANTFITFEEKTFFRRMKPFIEEVLQRQPSSSIFYIGGAQRSNSVSTQGDAIEPGLDGLNLISDDDVTEENSTQEDVDCSEHYQLSTESTVTLRHISNQNALTQSLMSDIESQVLKKFYDLTSKASPVDFADIEEEQVNSVEIDNQFPGISPSASMLCEESVEQCHEGTTPPPLTVSNNMDDAALILPTHSRQSSNTHGAFYGNFLVHTSDNDPGAVALTCGLLRLLTDILKVKLPDSMVPQVLGRTLKPELLLTLAMHPSLLVRERVLETYLAYLDLSFRFSDALLFADLDMCLLLSNQIHQFVASRRLVEVAFSIVIGQNRLINLSSVPHNVLTSQRSDSFMTAGHESLVDLSSGDQQLPNDWTSQISYCKSFPVLAALLERTAEDGELCRQTVVWLHWILQGNDSLINAALDCGLCESLLNTIFQLNFIHPDFCPQEDTQYWQVLAAFEQLVSFLTQWMFFSSDPRHFVLCVDFIRLLHALEDTESKRSGCNSCSTEFCQHLVCHSLQSILDYVSDYADRPPNDYLTNEKSLKGRRNTAELFGLNLSNMNAREENLTSHSLPSASAQTRHRYSKSWLSSSSSHNEVSMKDLISRFPRMICMMVDFVGFSKKLFGPLTKEMHFKELFKKSLLEFLIRASVHLSIFGSSNKKTSWGGFLWGNREVIRTLSARMLVYMTLSITDLTSRCLVIDTLMAEQTLTQVLKFVFASQNVAVYQFYNNLEDFSAMLYTEQVSLVPPDCLSGVSTILSGLRSQKLVKEQTVSRSVPDIIESSFSTSSISYIEEETVWARKETLRRQQWEQRVADTITTWKNRCSSNSSAMTDQAIRLTKIIVNTQNVLRKRFIETIKRKHADTISMKKQWRQIIHHLTHERAVWHDPTSYPHHWEMDPTEGASRVRKRLRRCYLEIDSKFFKTHSPHRNHKCCLSSMSSLLYLFQEDENSTDMDATLQQLHVNDKISLTMRCSWVSMGQSSLGELLVGETAIYFVGDQSVTKELFSQNKLCCNDSSTFTWPFEDIRAIHTRRYELRDIAIEIFLSNGLNYLLSMDTTKERDIVYSKIKSLPLPNLVSSPSLHQLQQSWLAGQLTNFDYLTHLNTLAGRSYNDLMQYPIFPFVLKDYSSSVLDLCRPDVYRNLSKPIAVQNSDALVRQKYAEKLMCYQESRISAPDMYSAIPPFHYASHYSNSATVLHYLIRLPPFTQKFINFQDNNFDVPDRSFHTMSSCYTLSTTSISSVKELIPEFFYLPEFFDNFEEFEMGLRQNGELVDHVKLPKWCNNDPRLFNLIHRAALESSYVTEQLAGWIDLIFGVKQVGKPALEALNLFHPYTYFEAINPDDIEDPVRRRAVEDMIRNYGQTPKQLFNRRGHPSRRITYPLPGFPGGPHSGSSSPGLLSVSASGLPTGFGPDITTRQQKEVLLVFPNVYGLVWGPWVGSPSEPDVVLTWRQEYPLAICAFSPLPIVPTSGGNSTSQPDYSSLDDSNVTTTTGQSFDYAILGCEAFARLLHISHPVTGQRVTIKLCLHHTENSIMATVLELRNSVSNTVNSSSLSNYCKGPLPLVRLDPRWKVTCLALANRKRRIYVGLESGLIVVISFKVSFMEKQFPILVDGQSTTLYAHTQPVTCLAICESFRLLASGDTAGNVVLWDTNKLRYIRQIIWPSSLPTDHGKTNFSVREATISQPVPALGEVLLMTFSETLGDLAIVRRIKQGRSWLSVFSLNARHIASQHIDARIHSMVYSNLAEGQNVNVLVLGLSHGRLRFLDSWRLVNVNRLQIDQKQKSPIIALCFAPGARRLYASSEDGCVYLLESREVSVKQNLHSEHFIPCIEW